MNSFYSIVYLKSDSISDEKIAVGLFLKSGSKPFFDYSPSKLKIASKLLDKDVIDSTERALKNIKQAVLKEFKPHNQTEAFDIEPFTASYFNYLSRYANNILLFTDPNLNTGKFNDEDFSYLFELIVDKNFNSEKKDAVELSFNDKVSKSILNSPVSERVDVEYKFTRDLISSIYRATTVNFVGANGNIVSGNSIDTNSDYYTIENKLYTYRALTEGLSEFAKTINMKDDAYHVVLFNDTNDSKKRNLIAHAMSDDSSPFELKPWNEFPEIENYVQSRNVMKLSELLAQ